jgi:hypothetical protein
VTIPQISSQARAQYLRRLMRSDAASVRVLIGCVFVRVVTEPKTYRIYEVILQTIKAITRNLSGASNFIA